MAMNPEELTNIVFAAIYTLFYITGIPLFIYFRNKEPIRSRGWLLSVLQMTPPLIDLHMRGEGYDPVPCSADTWRSICLIPLWIYPYFTRVFALWYKFNLQNTLLLQRTTTLKGRIILWIQAHPWVTSTSFELVLFLVYFVLCTVLALGTYYPQAAIVPGDCSLDSTFYINILQGVIGILCMIASVVVLWGVNDAYLLKFEFVYLLFVGLPLFIVWIVSQEMNWDAPLDNGLWVDLIEVLFILGTIHLPLYGTRMFARLLMKTGRSQDDSSSDSRLSVAGFEDVRFVLNDEVLLPSLEQFMVQSWAIENLMFLQNVEEYRVQTGEKRQKMAQIILQDFICEGESPNKSSKPLFASLFVCLSFADADNPSCLVLSSSLAQRVFARSISR